MARPPAGGAGAGGQEGDGRGYPGLMYRHRAGAGGEGGGPRSGGAGRAGQEADGRYYPVLMYSTRAAAVVHKKTRGAGPGQSEGPGPAVMAGHDSKRNRRRGRPDNMRGRRPGGGAGPNGPRGRGGPDNMRGRSPGSGSGGPTWVIGGLAPSPLRTRSRRSP